MAEALEFRQQSIIGSGTDESILGMVDLQPDSKLIEITKSMMDAVIELATVSDDDTSDILDVIHATPEFSVYWDAWQGTIGRVIRIHARNSGFAMPVDSFIQLEMLLGDTGNQPNVGIFHKDMTNAPFLPDSADTTAIRESHRITERIFSLRGDNRNDGFAIFAMERSNLDVRRGIFALSDSHPTEMADFGNPSAIEGYKLYPGNISNGEYLFGSQGVSPAYLAGEDWDNWRQALPWKFVDLTDSFHRAPPTTSDRNLLLRLDTYVAPARDPGEPVSIRIPLYKYYPPVELKN